MNTKLTFRRAAVAVAHLTLACIALPAAAQPGGDALLNRSLADYRAQAPRGEWVNPWMPAGTGARSSLALSGDQRMAQHLAGFTREALDRGGWVNTVLASPRYASGNPLMAIAVGAGVTTRVAARDQEPVARLTDRLL